jgi:type IV pilus assembly protein PilM
MNRDDSKRLISLINRALSRLKGLGKGWLKLTGDRIVGCVQEGEVYRFVLVQREEGRFKVKGQAQLDLRGAQVKRLDKESIKSLGLTGEELWVTPLSSSALFIRKTRIELTKDRAIDLALPFQVESRLPFPVEESVLGWTLLERDEKGSDLLLIATRASEVVAHLARWQAIGIDPGVVTLAGLGLVDLVSHLELDLADCAILNIGEERALLAVMRQGKLVAVRDVERLELSEILRALLSVAAFREVEEAPILIIGGALPLREMLAAQLGRPVIPIAEELTSFALPLAVALAGGRSERSRVNFRQGTHRVKRPWWRLRKKLALFASLSVALALALHLLGGRLRERAESQLRRDYLQLLDLTGETEVALPRRAGEIQEEVRRIERKLATSRDLFPLNPNLPGVSDFLVWIATQPTLVRDGEPLVRIERVRYCLERYPNIKRPKERYQARVELDFKAQSSTIAREFHDALLSSNEWIDPQVEVQWRSTPTGYRTSFCLRDRTFYPSNQ